MDGKQARRTGSSSPLGLLFDHGCDAVNSIFGSVNWIIGMALVPNEHLLECWALVFGPYAMFYVATWEQYHTGELILPIVNGPNEGLLGGALLSFTSWYLGPFFWQGTEWYEGLQAIFPLPSSLSVRNCDFVILASCIGFVQEMALKSISVGSKHTEAFATILPFVVLTTCFFLIGFWDPELLLSFPRTALHLSMLLFVEMSTELMLAHVTSQPFTPFRRWQLLPLVGLSLWICVVGSSDSLGYWLVTYTAGLAAYLSFKIVSVIREMCHTLHIWCFDIVTPYPSDSSDKRRMTKED
jgi:ethanolaminephosphotransferase